MTNVPEDFYLSGERGGGWADPVGNDTVLPFAAFLETAGYLIAGRFPMNILLTFLHEGTHHWCFEGALGYAVSATWLRARRRASRIVDKPDATVAERYDLADDLIRYWSVVLLLRPLSEGMALFAEHDLYPNVENANEVLPPFFSWALVQAGNYAEYRDLPAAEEEFLRRLVANRVSLEGVRRKKSLFARSLSTADGGYLAGYMTVKSIWRAMIRSSPRLVENKGLFLSLLHDRVFASTELLQAMFEPGREDVRIAEAIVQTFQRRIQTLLTMSDADVATFESESLRPAERHRRRGSDELELPDEVRQLFRDAEDLTEPEWAAIDTATLNRRHLMRLFSVPVRVQVNSHGRVLVYPAETSSQNAEFEMPNLSFGAFEDVQEGVANGHVEYHISMTLRYFALVVFRDNQMVAALVPDEHKDEIAEYLTGSVDALRRFRDASNQLMQRAVENHDIFEVAMAGKSVRELMERLYQRWAIPVESDEAEERVAVLMRRQGFWTLLDEETAQVTALAVSSVATSALLAIPDVRSLFERAGATYPDDLNALHRTLDTRGLPLFLGAGDHRVCLL